MPRETYVLHDLYCDDLSCDCRVAQLVVLRGELGNDLETDAVLTVGWEPIAFYCREGLPFPALHGSMLAPDPFKIETHLKSHGYCVKSI